MLTGVDTESTHDGKPLSVQLSVRDRQGRMYPANKLARSAVHQTRQGTTFVLHNAAHDLEVLRSLGISLEDASWHDTMLAARILGEPGGLKALALRRLGVPMQDYGDVLAPAKAEAWGRWLRKLTAELKRRTSWAVRTGKGWALATYIRTLDKAHTAALLKDEPIDLAERWRASNMPESYRAKVRAAVGPDPAVDLRDVDEPTRVAYACRDSDVTRRCWPGLERELVETGAWRAYETDRAMAPVLGRIRTVGMQVDTDALRALELDMERELSRLTAEMTRVVGRSFNPASVVDVGGVLFGDLAQPPRRLTTSGRPSTESKQIEAMRNGLLVRKAERGLDDKGERALAFLDLLVEQRHIAKLKSTNVTGLWQFLDSDNRIHPDLRMEAASGRCVAGGRDERGRETPNALAVPRRTAWGQRVRKCYTAGEGRRYVVVDLSQIEMRMMAHLSHDANMVAILNDPKRNIHKETAVYIFNTRSGKHPDLTVDTVKQPMTKAGASFTFYDAGKTMGFGMLFGMTEWGGQQNFAKVGVLAEREEVADWIVGWNDFFPGVGEYRECVVAAVRECGYSVTPMGRRRYLPFVHSPHERDRSEAERQAVNHTIQGGAIEHAKVWVAAVHRVAREYRAKGRYCEIVLTVHDETDLVCDAEIADEVGARCVALAKELIQLSVPVDAEASTGATWGDAK